MIERDSYCIILLKVKTLVTLNSLSSYMASGIQIKCPLCSATEHLKLNLSEYLKHVRLFHAHQPDFKLICGISGCQRSFTNAGTFQNHAYSVHKDTCKQAESHNNEATSHVPDPDDDMNEGTSISVHSDHLQNAEIPELMEEAIDEIPSLSLQSSSALFLLGLKEKYKLPQVAIQGIIEGVTSLIQHQNSLIKSQVKRACTSRVTITPFLLIVHVHLYRFMLNCIKQK